MVEKELKESCSPCVCVFRSIEKFVRQGQSKFPIKNNNPEQQLITTNKK
jgi:hypothetical protein